MTATLIRRTGAFILIAGITATLAACGGIGARLTFTDTEKTKVTEIAVEGGSGDVTVHTAAVTGGLTSGDVRLSDIRTADLTLTSGDIVVSGATAGVKASSRSGDMTVTDSRGAVTLQAGSGDLRAVDLAGPVSARTTSGDIEVRLTAPASVTAEASSGDVRVTVPAGAYRVRTARSSGDASVGITDDPSAANVLDVRTRSGDVTITAA